MQPWAPAAPRWFSGRRKADPGPRTPASSRSESCPLTARIDGCGCQNRYGIPFWLVGEFTTHFRTYFSGDWDVHLGYDLGFDPWPDLGCCFWSWYPFWVGDWETKRTPTILGDPRKKTHPLGFKWFINHSWGSPDYEAVNSGSSTNWCEADFVYPSMVDFLLASLKETIRKGRPTCLQFALEFQILFDWLVLRFCQTHVVSEMRDSFKGPFCIVQR